MEQFIRVAEIFIAIGLVIFVHELGHFLVARWSGVLVERFSIGFGPLLLSFKRGDTEYAISAIPLGGYVKMLGEAPDPEEEEPVDDQRSFQNKSVGKRMAIISAGVVMNIIFGFLCFVAAYQLGVSYLPAVVGTAIPGKPAWEAGLRAGDEIIEINGRRPTSYELLTSEVALTKPPTESVRMTIVRQDEQLDLEITPNQEEMKPQIGVLPSLGLELVSNEPTGPYTPAARANNPSFEGGGRVVAVDGERVNTYRQFVDLMFAKRAEKVTITVQRRSESSRKPQTLDVQVEPNYVRRLGLEMQISGIVAIQSGSPATRARDLEGNPATIQPKDVIKAVDGVKDIDPMRLPDVVTAKAGQEVELTLLRPGQDQKEIKVIVVPEAVPTWLDFPDFGFTSGDQPLSIPSLGIAYGVLSTVHRVIEDMPAAQADKPILPGDKITAVTYGIEGANKLQPVPVERDQWASIFWAMQFPEVRKLQLTVERAGVAPFQVTLEPRLDESWPLRLRGLRFAVAEGVRKESSFMGALGMGVDKTRASIVQIYLFLRRLIFTRTISPKNLLGPISIATVAYSVADNISKLIELFGLLSINLAIINFLPIPILDGGHMVFLFYELLWRRKASERAMLVANYVGLILICSLMFYVIALDITRLF